MADYVGQANLSIRPSVPANATAFSPSVEAVEMLAAALRLPLESFVSACTATPHALPCPFRPFSAIQVGVSTLHLADEHFVVDVQHVAGDLVLPRGGL